MKIFCLEDFKVEYSKLSAKKSYRNLEREMISYFFDKSIGELASGVLLNNNEDIPYIKKRLGGSAGYRFYFLLVIKNDSLYLMFVHPKTGSSGSSNITDESKTYLYKKVFYAMQNQDFYELKLDKNKNKILFRRHL
jgi:hypothetical protein